MRPLAAGIFSGAQGAEVVAGERRRGGHQAAGRWRVGAVLRCECGVIRHEGPLLSAVWSVLRQGFYEISVVATTMLIRKSVKKSRSPPEKDGYFVLNRVWCKNTGQDIDLPFEDCRSVPLSPGPIPFLHQGPEQNQRARGGSGFCSTAARRAVRSRRSPPGGRRAAPGRAGR